MPPTRTRKAPKRGAEGGVSSSAALEDEVGVGDREEWEDAALCRTKMLVAKHPKLLSYSMRLKIRHEFAAH